MLGKLLKHEWKTVWKVPVLLIAVLMVIAVIAGFTFALPIWDSEWIGLPLSGVMMILVFYFAMIAVGVGITIYFAVRYYRNMFTDEGYLTHTLPVTTHQLLLNKVITVSAWNLISGVAVVISLILFLGIMFLSLASKDSSFAREFVEEILSLRGIWKEPFFHGIGSFLVSAGFMTIVSSISGTMIIIASITLGQMVHTHRVLGSIGAYFAISTVVQGVNMVIMFPLMLKMTVDNDFLYRFEKSPFAFYTMFDVIMSVVYAAIAVGLYFLSEYLLRKKLELE